MQFKDQVDFVRQHIKKNRMRVFMTVLAATMGTAFLIVLASVGFGIHETVRSSILSDRKVTEIQVYSGQEFTEEEVEDFKKIEFVNAVVNRYYVDANSETRFKDRTGGNQLMVTDFVEEGKAGFKLSEGRLPKDEFEVVVGSDFARYLHSEEDLELEDGEELKGYEGNLLGETFDMVFRDLEGEFFDNNEVTFTIVGVGKAPARDWDTDQNIYADTSIMPNLEKMLAHTIENPDDDHPDASRLFYGDLTIHADQLENVADITKTLKEKGLSVYSVTEELDEIGIFFLVLKVGLVFVGTIAILIASIGIFNTMTMAVTERTREIGVMKAIGASPKLIQRLFLMESAFIGLLGTVFAIIISYGISMLANFILPIIVASALGEEDLGTMEVTFTLIPWQLVLIASVISISVAIVSGWRPARKATKIDVIQALRQEL